MYTTDTADLWYKTAVIYCVDVESFLDSDGDGIGDLQGVTQRIDYLAQLDVTCLWLMPFYPSPRKDHGYDITDGYAVDPRYGDAGDFVELIRVAHDRGLKVIIDLVINHTSDQHPWFRQARRSKDSAYRDYYIWRSDTPPDTSDQTAFPDAEDGVWFLDEKTGEYYLHNFYRHQPDLNTSNPKVQAEIHKVMGYWLQLGIDGFRVDAVPSAMPPNSAVGDDQQSSGQPHEFLRQLRDFLDRRATGRGPTIMLGEVNLPHEEQVEYFGRSDGDELTMQFDFLTNQRLYLSLARGEAGPLEQALESRAGDQATRNQYANFVRNHDELNLELLDEDERNEVFEAYAPDEQMQLPGIGIRRRLPPMVAGDPRILKLVYALLFSLPGTPVLFYGEEIGLGENLKMEGREAVRPPMQWSNCGNGGFSLASPRKLSRPVVQGPYGPAHVNAAAARRDPDSLLLHIQKMARSYRDCPELGWGEHRVLRSSHPSVLAHRVDWRERTCILLHNLSSEAVLISCRLENLGDCMVLVDVLDGSHHVLGEKGEMELNLDAYGFSWLKPEDEMDFTLQ